MVEIERVRSISQAAENLYIGQPNLSRILKDVEESIGYPVFLRTTHGVRPTERGAIFLQHAHNILREMESINLISPHQMVSQRLRVCIPRSAVTFQLVSNFVKDALETQHVHVEIRECHAKRAIESISGGQAEIGVIRFRQGYEEYFQELVSNEKLTYRKIRSYEDVILMHESHPLADRKKLKWDELTGYVQILHGDNYFLPQNYENIQDSEVYTVDRQAQLSLLENLSGSYMWSVPQDEQMLQTNHLVQKVCSGYSNHYCEALVYNHLHTMNDLESGLISLFAETE